MAEDTKLTPSQSQKVDEYIGEISKTLTTGYEINPGAQEGGAVLRREFLDDQIATLTWTEGDLDFFRDVTRRPSESTVAQYDVYLRHGRVGHSRFVREIGIAPISDPNIKKKRVNMKFVSDTKQMSLASGLVNNIADPARILTDDAIAVVAKSIEWASFYGDGDLSDNIDADSGVEFNGLAKLIDKHNVIDAKGEPLTEELLNRAAVTIGKGYGTATDAYMPIGVQADFINGYLNRQTQLVRDNGDNVNVGFKIQGFNSARGFIKLHGSTVMENDNILDESMIPMPTAPREATVTLATEIGVKGKFRPDFDLKAHSYKVVVHSDEAESAPSEVKTATVANATDGVRVTVKVSGMYQQRPQFVSIYRQGEETQLFYLIARVPMSKATEDGTINFLDVNDTIPETADIFVGEMTPNVVHLFELLPMMRLPLAQMNATVTFSVLWYGALALRAPKKWVRVKNVRYVPVSDPHGAY